MFILPALNRTLLLERCDCRSAAFLLAAGGHREEYHTQHHSSRYYHILPQVTSILAAVSHSIISHPAENSTRNHHVDHLLLGVPGHLGLYVAGNADCYDIDVGSRGKATL